MFKPRYTITNKILTSVAQIEVAKEVVESLLLAVDWETKFRQDGLIRTIYFGAHIDGNSLTLNQVERIVKEDPGRDESAEGVAKQIGIVALEKDVQEVVNYHNLLRFVHQLARLGKKTGIAVFGEKELLQMHSLLMEKLLPSHQLGVYRMSSTTNQMAPLAVEVPYQMEDFWSWLKNTNSNNIHCVIKAAIVCSELNRICPFAEGNEKIARVFAFLVLASDGYSFKHFLSIEEYLDRDRVGYGEALMSTGKNTGDMTIWIEFFCEVLMTELIKLKERVRRLSADSAVQTKLAGKQIALSERQIALMEILRLKEEITIQEARSVLPMVSDDTILRDLMSLVEKRLVKKRGKTKGARYLLR